MQKDLLVELSKTPQISENKENKAQLDKDYDNFINDLVQKIVLHPKPYIEQLKRAAEIVKANTVYGWFANTEHNHARQMLKEMSESKDITSIIHGLKYVIKNCEKNAKQGLQATISVLIIHQRGNDLMHPWSKEKLDETKELLKKLQKNPCDILENVNDKLIGPVYTKIILDIEMRYKGKSTHEVKSTFEGLPDFSRSLVGTLSK